MIQNISPVTNDTEHLTLLHVTHTSQLIQNWSVFLWGTHRSISVMKRPLSGSLIDSLTAPAHTNTSDLFNITLTFLYNFEISIFDLCEGKVFIKIRCKSLLLFTNERQNRYWYQFHSMLSAYVIHSNIC